MRYFIEVTVKSDNISILKYENNPAIGSRTDGAKLRRSDTVAVEEKLYTLNEIVDLIRSSYSNHSFRPKPEGLDERDQVTIGHFLYQQLFGDINPAKLQPDANDAIELRIITNDDFIASLPWPLLAYQGSFLSSRGWSVTLARTNQVEDCYFPDHPRILIIAPEPVMTGETNAKEHIKTLLETISRNDETLSAPNSGNIRVVRTWIQFTEALEEFHPHIVYFYGHSKANNNLVRLLFASELNLPKEISMADFAQHLRELPESPLLAYVNCCDGDAAGMLGAGWQLGESIPVVITNRTRITVDDARAQAIALLSAIITEQLPPHRALAQLYARQGALNLSFSDTRWITPVLHGRYGLWIDSRPAPTEPSVSNTQWKFRLDRVKQYSIVANQTRTMIDSRQPRSLAYIWFGHVGQGVEIFHQRLRNELKQGFNVGVVTINPAWPKELDEPEIAFEEMMNDALNSIASGSLPPKVQSKIRQLSKHLLHPTTLLYANHLPFTSSNNPVTSHRMLSLEDLYKYLIWWDKTFIPNLGTNQYALLALSFEVKNSAQFHRNIKKSEIMRHHFTNITLELLDEMEKLAEKDLRDFIRTNNIKFPGDQLDRIIEQVLNETQGNYEQTIKVLNRIINQRSNRS